ncbi:hypothetical protein Pmi06nite_74540 [Planotetraspora mira]|uniref:Uncharacterized protein n=1 Tax=Planotetraspora mira TaxID=58121 RepID=A0A8J3XAG2_9ACTN|nr:hypothetical protein Pmi06nite_74540 [Planotetraspora mira]
MLADGMLGGVALAGPAVRVTLRTMRDRTAAMPAKTRFTSLAFLPAAPARRGVLVSDEAARQTEGREI